jgi:hypothetical protein
VVDPDDNSVAIWSDPTVTADNLTEQVLKTCSHADPKSYSTTTSKAGTRRIATERHRTAFHILGSGTTRHHAR